MAYSSEPVKKAERGFIPPQNDEECFLMRRVEELCVSAVRRGMPRYTGFFSDREQVLAAAAAHRCECDCVRFEGGYPQAERRIFCIEPVDTWTEIPYAVLKFRCDALSKEKMPSHRDYLGSILGLGLDRACLGDLLADHSDAAVYYAIVTQDKAQFICDELRSVGRWSVHGEICDTLPEELLSPTQREIQEATVSSLRVDAVAAAMLHTSRTKIADYISCGKVEVNHLPVKVGHEAVYEGDVFTVRGIGKYRLTEIGGQSKKDRTFISYYKYD